MIENVLRKLGGIENYGILSLCLFVGIFTLIVIWAVLQKKAHLDRMANLPLETDSDSSLSP